jgi:hypothetical protein
MLLDISIFQWIANISLIEWIFLMGLGFVIIVVLEPMLLSTPFFPIFSLRLFHLKSKVDYQITKRTFSGERKVEKNSMIYYFKTSEKIYFRSTQIFLQSSSKLKGTIKIKNDKIKIYISILFGLELPILCGFAVMILISANNIYYLISNFNTLDFKYFFSNESNVGSHIFLPFWTCIAIAVLIYAIFSMKKKTYQIMEDVIQILEENTID